MAAAKKTAAKKAATKTATKPAPKAAAPKPAATHAPAPAPTHAPVATATAQAVGFFDVVSLERAPWGILALVFNIIPGGVGTIIAGAKASATNQIIKGVVQLLLTGIFVGWVWSVIDGIRMFTRSR